MDILSVLQKHGHTTHSLAKEIGVKQSTLMGMIKGNPTISTLRKLSDALKCPVAEFFFDELKSDPKWVERFLDEPGAAGYIVTPQGGQQEQSAASLQQEQSSAALQQAIVCPHCSRPIVITVR